MTSDERKARIHERTMRDPIWRSDADGTMTSSASDGIPDDYENLPEGASPNWTIMDELPPGKLASDGLEM